MSPHRREVPRLHASFDCLLAKSSRRMRRATASYAARGYLYRTYPKPGATATEASVLLQKRGDCSQMVPFAPCPGQKELQEVLQLAGIAGHIFPGTTHRN